LLLTKVPWHEKWCACQTIFGASSLVIYFLGSVNPLQFGGWYASFTE
jgi:hypothetical protein